MSEDKLFLTRPELFKSVVLQEKSGACSQWFKACLDLPNLTHDAWLERRSADFQLWASDLHVGNKTLDSLGVRLRFRPDVVETAVGALNGLARALSGYHAIATNTVPPESDEPASDLDEGELSDQDQGESSHGTRSVPAEFDVPAELKNTGHYAACLEKRAYIDNNLNALIRIHIDMHRSRPMFRYELVDQLLRQDEIDYQKIKIARGEHRALETQFGEHEKFRRRLTRLVLGNLYSENLMLKLGIDIHELVTSSDTQEKTTYERRLIEANVVRRNRLTYLVGARTTNCVQGKLMVSYEQSEMFELMDIIGVGDSAAAALNDVSDSPSHAGVLEEHRDEDASAVAMRFATVPEKSFTITGALARAQLSARLIAGKALEDESTNVTNMPPSIDSLDLDEDAATARIWNTPIAPFELFSDGIHVAIRPYIDQETLPYVCIFDGCEYAEETFGSKYEWMSHIVNSHADRAWFCPQCPSRSDSTTVVTFDASFSERSALHEHISAYHSISDSSELELLADGCRRVTGIPETRCPLCPPRGFAWDVCENEFLIPTKASDFVRLENDEHVATHLRQFALEALRTVAEQPVANSKSLHPFLPRIYVREFTEPYPVAGLTLACFKILWEQLPQATNTLCLLSFLADREIPLWLLPGQASLRALSGLRNCAFFQVGRKCLRINSSVRLAVQAWVEKLGHMKTIITNMFRHISRKLPRSSVLDRFDESITATAPHFSSILGFRSYHDRDLPCSEAEDRNALLRVLEYASDLFFYISDYAESYQLAKEAVEICRGRGTLSYPRYVDNEDRSERASRALNHIEIL
ncbi:hypothetical protein NLG97_g9917 [Lecanicillium saksenae]|uniref:Uncharacterized protein n=1 Tax=Lecanicillium saksenae TaxID=468837 RepID=A0ACC1QG52_9HYPO|nr:hypothetical protein NLG97_g9917 [Lecanicillium saksenae]